MLTFFANRNRGFFSEKIAHISLFKNLDKKIARSGLSTAFTEEVARSLTGFISRQEQAIAKAESGFMLLGEDIQNMYAETSGLSQQIRASVGIIAGSEEEGVLEQLGRSVTDSLAQLETCKKEVSSNLHQVDAVNVRLNDFYNTCPVLEKIAQFLRVIGLNICIESAQSSDATELFMVNAHEIKTFAENVIEITEKIREDSQNAQSSLISVHDRITAGLSQMQSLSSTTRQVVRDAFLGIEEMMTLSLQTMEQAGSRSTKITRQVGEIVVGIQFHDSMNQRIEHIHKALDDAACRCVVEDSAADSSRDRAERMADVRSIIVLQAGQIKEIISGIEEVYQQNSQAFTEIGSEVAGLAEDLVSLAAVNKQEKTDDPFAALQSALLQLRHLLEQENEQISQIQEAGSQASGTAARLSTHIERVRAIAHETHIKSLNSIVKANHLGVEGRTIEVLANEIKKLSDQSNLFVVDVEQIHEFISQEIVGLQREESAGSPLDSVSLDADIKETTKAYEHFQEDSGTSLQRAAELKDEILRISVGLDFLPTLAAELQENLSQLEVLIDRLSPWAGQLSAEAQEEADKVAHRYTTDQERIVHQQLLASATDSECDNIEMHDQDADDSDDFEMFEQDSDAGDIEMFDQDDESDDDFEMFTDDVSEPKTTEKKKPETPDEAAKKANDTDDLGDNVELF